MDCYFARIRSRICFGEIEEIVDLSGLISDFPSVEKEEIYEDTFVDEHIFLISTLDPWYRNIIVYLQTLKVPIHLSRDER